MEDVKSALWIQCPFCGGKTQTKVYPETVLLNYPLSCPHCGKEAKVDVIKLKMVVSKESGE